MRVRIQSLVTCLIAGLALAHAARAETIAMTKAQTIQAIPKSAAFGDMDQDGDLDLIVAVSSVFRLYDNQGGRLSSSPKSYSAPTINGVAVGDLNGDDRLDVVSAGTDPFVFLSDGNGTLATRVQIPRTGSSCVVLADMDGDGDLDIVLGGGSYDGFTQVYPLIAIYTNEGGTFAWPPRKIGGGHTDAIAVGDLDGDGDLDIVSAKKPQAELPGDAEVYRNDGGSFQLVWSTYFTGGGGFNDVDLCDMDGDGDLDMVLSSGRLEAFANQGTAQIFPDYLSGPAWSYNAGSGVGTVLGDIDLDGTIDLASIGSTRLEVLTAPNGSSWTNVGFSVQSQGLGTVLADIDNDGDLDMLAEDNTAVSLYVNQSEMSSRMFGKYAVFTASPGIGGAVELGDVNGDGHLDLLRGVGSGGAGQLFYGTGDTFVYPPRWQSQFHTAGFGRSVAFGDVDGDGDLDVIDQEFPPGGVTMNLYVNNNGELGLPRLVDALGAMSGAVQDFALGDIDGDGDLDLAVVPYNAPSVVLLYDNGNYKPVPEWTMAPSHETQRVLFGDLDRDVDSDLLFLNRLPFLNDEIYMSNEGVLGNNADFLAILSLSPAARVLGDVNQDGFQDLVVSDGSLNLFMNNGGAGFKTVPAFTSTAAHDFVTLADMDGDGDLDVVAGAGSGQSPGVYANARGTIDRNPSWTWSVSSGYHAVTTGDVDGDGDADLVVDPYVFKAVRLPVYKGDTIQPSRQLPNNGTFLRHVRMTPDPLAEDEYNVSWTCYDVESDRARIVMEYHFEGDSLWSAPVATSSWFKTSPAGVSGQLHWDAGLVPLDPRPVELRLRLAESPTRVSVIQHAAPYLKSVGRLLAHRPMVNWLSDFSFPGTTTLGDTTVATATFKNLGSRDLVVSQAVIPPSSYMWLVTTLPVVVPPRQEGAISIAAAPHWDADISGEITLHTNDPGSPEAQLGVFGKVTGLVIGHELVTPVDTLALGQAVTVLVIPAPFVHVENGTVFYRARGETEYKAVALSSFGSNWIANIPGEGVKESGLEYFISVENTPASGSDPENEPATYPYFRAVRPPSEITTTAVPTAGQDYLSGRSIEILVSLPQGSDFQSGLLHYHAGGEQEDHVDTLSTDTGLPSGTIDEALVGARGIEYWVEVKTGTRDLTDPPANPSSNPRRIQITVPGVTEPTAHAGTRYRMVSFPIEFGESFSGTIEDILTDEKGLGEYNAERWRSWVWVTDKNGYGELSDRTVAYLFRPKPGRAYWLVTKNEHQVDTGPVAGRSTPTDEPYELTVKPGWTMIGDPFAFDVAWSTVMSDTLAASEDTLLSGPYAYNGSRYRREDRLKPFSGYWVRNEHAGDVVLRIPPAEASANVVLATAEAPQDGWTVGVVARCAGLSATAEVGVSALAGDGRDRFDELLPPMGPGDGISVYVAGQVARVHDVRSMSTWRMAGGVSVPLDLAKNFTVDRGGDEVTLSFDLGRLSPEGHAILIDRKLGRATNLREASGYTFIAGERAIVSESAGARFTLVIGTDAYLQSQKNLVPALPTNTALHQNTPNPFNPVTVIRYDLASPSEVSLRIYDLRGALVKSLVRGNKPAGRYEVGWNGENEHGVMVASGVYFYELRAGSFRQARKMVLLK